LFELHAEVRKLCCQQLGIDCDILSTEEVSRRILGSQHARDFFIKDDTIRNWRSKYVEDDYKRHKNDRMSVEAWVCFPPWSPSCSKLHAELVETVVHIIIFIARTQV
jgi:hypothetical protein